MATNVPARRSTFDSARQYAAAREFLLAGKTFTPGDPVDAGVTDVRRLRQLFDQGLLKLAPGQDDNRRVVARREVLIAGQRYEPGGLIPSEAFASSVRLEQMIRQGAVRFVNAGPAQPRRATSRRATSRRAAPPPPG